VNTDGVERQQETSAQKRLHGVLTTLEEALRKESLPARSAAGLAVNRACAADSEPKQAYKACGSQSAAERFRKEWAEAELEKARNQGRRATESTKKLEWKAGKYLSPLKIWEAEGKDSPGLEATQRILRFCMAKGPPFTRFNKITGRLDYLRMEAGMSESYEEEFCRWEEAQLARAAAENDDEMATQRGGKRLLHGEPKKQEPAAKAKARSGAKVKAGSGSKSGQAPGGAADGGEQTALNKGIAKAAKLRTRYRAAAGRAFDVMLDSERDPEWAWAAGTPQRAALAAAQATLQAAKRGGFAETLLSADTPPGQLLRDTEVGVALGMLASLSALEDAVHATEKACATMVAMHRVAQGAARP
jgi:hypothetical protein